MSIQERKEREKNERRALIMRCAKELILEHGIGEASMEAIAARADLSRATLYLYFKDREDLFREISDESRKQFVAYFHARDKEAGPGLSALDRLKLYWRCCLDTQLSGGEGVLRFNLLYSINPEILFDCDNNDQCQGPIYKLLESCIEQGKTEGLFDRNIDTGTVVRLLVTQPSIIMGRAARGRKGARDYFDANRSAMLEIKRSFEIILRGIVKDTVDPAILTLPEQEGENEN